MKFGSCLGAPRVNEDGSPVAALLGWEASPIERLEY